MESLIKSNIFAYRDSSPEVIDDAEESELESIPSQVDIAHHAIAQHSFEPGKRSFHCFANAALVPVEFLLFLS